MVEALPAPWTGRFDIELREQTRVGWNGAAITLLWAEMPDPDGDDGDGAPRARDRPASDRPLSTVPTLRVPGYGLSRSLISALDSPCSSEQGIPNQGIASALPFRNSKARFGLYHAGFPVSSRYLGAIRT